MKFTVDCNYNVFSGYIAGAETLEGAIAKAQWARGFYEPMYPGTVKIGLFVECDACKGSGRIAKGRKNVRFPKYTDCACCNGRGSFPVPAVA